MGRFREDTLYEIDWTEFRNRLRALMDSRGYNMSDLSRATNMSLGSISRYFYERTPDLRSACIIADHFGVSLDWILGRSEKKFLDLSSEAKELYCKYQKADATDRTIINTVLAKYE